ncbi:MAG: ATP-binding protein [Deltaproteobacteria bacterium]|nr:ATP-binding protein [Deltaproteobacteria bacterium]
MSASERIPFRIEINQIIELLAKQIYQSPLALLRENCQNAYDAILQRRYLGQYFEPEISVTITPTEVRVTDNGIGMTKQDLVNHYWRAGSSGKNNAEARAAGVVGTFGIGAMANFGVASELIVITESARDGQRTASHALRETLSATEDCIEMTSEQLTGQPGTTVIAKIPEATPVNLNAATTYIREFVRHLDIPVFVNKKLVSQEQFEATVIMPVADWTESNQDATLGPQFRADVNLVVAKTGEVGLSLSKIRYSGTPIDGVILLRQGMHQIRTFRSRFALANASVSSSYGFGGIANSGILEPTAGREALTTSSLQFIQSLVTACDKYTSEKIAGTPSSNSNTGFMDWVAKHGRFELCSNLIVRMEPNNRSVPLKDISQWTKVSPFNYFDGIDQALINQYATEDQPLIVLSTRHPRKKCELGYLQSYCKVTRIVDAPTVLVRKPERDWTVNDSAFALRLMSILESDYFVHVQVTFGKISHGLPILVDTSKSPIEIVLDTDGATAAMILRLYDEDFMALTGMVKDFIRNVIFTKISQFVPSSTRQGAEAFLQALRRPREVFEIEKSDLGSLGEIWQDYLEGKLSLAEAAKQSTIIVRTNVQVVDRSATGSVASVIPDVLENQRILEQAESSDGAEELEALPAITRLEKESPAKLLTIEEDEAPLKGYRCFLAITDRVREDRVGFFLQPHRTEIVWAGQKAIYIFQHHSGQFGLYYELQSTELLADVPDGRSISTCTIVLKNQIYIPVPNEIRDKFIPKEAEKKRFEIRCELLFPDIGVATPDKDSDR